jgi:dCMP deaminase
MTNIVQRSFLSKKDLQWITACEKLAPIFSTCDKRQYASFVITSSGRVAGFGYNGSPPGHTHCAEAPCPRLSADVQPGSPYDSGAGRCISVHAEANALLYCDLVSRNGATLYVNGPPCPDCAKLILACGIARVVHSHDDRYPDSCLSLGIETISVIG